MSELLTTITGFSFLGAFVAFLVAAVILKFKSFRLTLVLGAAGLLAGWLGMMMWMFLTGGVQNSEAWAVIIPVVLSLLFCYLVLRVNKIKIKFYKPKWATDKGLAILLFGLLLLTLAYIALPSTGGVISTASIELNDNDFPNGKIIQQFTLVEYDGNDISLTTTDNSVSLEIEKASVRFPRIAEDPTAGQYIDFKINFAVSGYAWEKPYIKVFLFQDNDMSGTLTSGDALWSYVHMKYHTSPGGSGTEGHWKSWLLYGPSGQSEPYYQMSVIPFSGGDYMLMPVFSAVSGQFAQVWNDNGKVFSNTPEQYTSPEDQMSMQVDSNGYLTFIDDSISGFTGIGVGQSKTISGKIYCPEEVAGHSHGIIVQAFDQRTAPDMFQNGAQPLTTAIKLFQVTTGGGGGGGGTPSVDVSFASWGIVAMLGVATIGGTVAVVKYGPKIVTPK